MRKLNLIAALIVVFGSNSAFAAQEPGYNSNVDPNQNPEMEECKVVDKDGNGLILPYQADSGANLDNDASAWIWVPLGQCKRINAGDFSGVSQAIRNKIHPSDITEAVTTE